MLLGYSIRIIVDLNWIVIEVDNVAFGEYKKYIYLPL